MNTQKLEWQPLWDAMEKNPSEWIETTEKMYWEMLEVLPPIAQTRRGAFLVGEAVRDDEQGRAVYACFKKSGEQFYARNLTLEQFRIEVL